MRGISIAHIIHIMNGIVSDITYGIVSGIAYDIGDDRSCRGEHVLFYEGSI